MDEEAETVRMGCVTGTGGRARCAESPDLRDVLLGEVVRTGARIGEVVANGLVCSLAGEAGRSSLNSERGLEVTSLRDAVLREGTVSFGAGRAWVGGLAMGSGEEESGWTLAFSS